MTMMQNFDIFQISQDSSIKKILYILITCQKEFKQRQFQSKKKLNKNHPNNANRNRMPKKCQLSENVKWNQELANN